MTQEEKAKAYDGNYKAYIELINRLEGVKDAIKKQNYGIAMDILCNPYPEYQIITSTELKESEDERIRKELICFLETEIPQCNARDKYVAWLEKQGEQKPYGQRQECADCQFNYAGECKGFCAMKRGEQKPADKVEPKFHEGDMIIHKELGGDYIHNSHKITQVDILDKKYRLEGGLVAHFGEQDDYELVEQKPTWSEEDEKRLQSCLNVLQARGIMEVTETINTKWLKTLKNRVQSQPKQEWSEEDMKMIGTLIAIFEVNYPDGFYKVNPIGTTNMQGIHSSEIIKWLKLLKERYTWKPSEEHYELEEFAKIVRGNLTGISKAVQGLFEAKYLQLTGNKMYGGYKD